MKTTEERKQHWEKVYQTRSPSEVSWYQTHPESSLKLIEKEFPNKSIPLIDVGGGASVLVDYLVQAGFTHLSVLDISEQALQYAKNRLQDKSEQIQWYIDDVLTFKAPHQFELWHDRAVFHFLTTSEERHQYVETLKNSLIDQGHVIIATFGIGGPEQCSDLPIKQHNEISMMEELGNEFTLLETFDEYHLTPKNIQQKFSYFHCLFNRKK